MNKRHCTCGSQFTPGWVVHAPSCEWSPKQAWRDEDSSTTKDSRLLTDEEIAKKIASIRKLAKQLAKNELRKRTITKHEDAEPVKPTPPPSRILKGYC